jgi:hypothetical protein
MPSLSSLTMAPLIRWRQGSLRAMSIWISIVGGIMSLIEGKEIEEKVNLDEGILNINSLL